MGIETKTEVVKQTPIGPRRIDIDVWRDGKNLGGIEVKLGGSRYTPAQQLKDLMLSRLDNYRVNVVRIRRK